MAKGPVTNAPAMDRASRHAPPPCTHRRQVLAAHCGRAALPLLPGCAANGSPRAADATALPITPPGRALRAGVHTAAVAGQPQLPVWACDGGTPGLVLRLRRGKVQDLALHNALLDPTTIHRHGVRVPNAMGGVRHLTRPPAAPSETFRYCFVLPDAGTQWHRPTGAQRSSWSADWLAPRWCWTTRRSRWRASACTGTR